MIFLAFSALITRLPLRRLVMSHTSLIILTPKFFSTRGWAEKFLFLIFTAPFRLQQAFNQPTFAWEVAIVFFRPRSHLLKSPAAIHRRRPLIEACIELYYPLFPRAKLMSSTREKKFITNQIPVNHVARNFFPRPEKVFRNARFCAAYNAIVSAIWAVLRSFLFFFEKFWKTTKTARHEAYSGPVFDWYWR